MSTRAANAAGRLAGKVAVVTGGAQGIGRGIVEVFAEAGAAVAILDWNVEGGQAAAAEIASAVDTSVIFVEGDVSDEGSVRRAVDRIVAELGGLHILVNNAAVFIMKGIDATPEEWRKILAVNVIGPALMAKHAVPELRRSGGGAIVNIGSVSSFIAQKEQLTYNTTKGAIAAMTRCMALDLVDDNIRVNAVCPGLVWTSPLAGIVAEMGLTREEASPMAGLGGEQIMKRIGDPREIGYAALFLASDEASFVTGANMMVDGGYTAL